MQITDMMCPGVLACAEDGAKLIRQLVLPGGFTSVTQGTFKVDETAWKMVEMKFARRKLKMLFDFEHQSLGGKFGRADGLSPAAGWIHKLEYVEGEGIYAHVEWTEGARDLIKSKQYMYFSPVINVNAKGRVTELVSVAVTNTPALSGIDALAAKESHSKGNEMWKLKDARAGDLLGKVRVVLQEVTPEEEQATVEQVVEEADDVGALIAELKAALGLGEDVMPSDVLKAAIAAAGAGDEEAEAATEEAMKALKTSLSLDANADVKLIVAKVDEMKAGTVDGKKYAALAADLVVLKAEKAEREKVVLVEKYVAAGKLNPNDTKQMTWANSTALERPEDFEAAMEVASVVMPPDGQVTDETGGANGREAIKASAVKAFAANAAQLPGVQMWSFVDMELEGKGQPRLSETERKSLTA